MQIAIKEAVMRIFLISVLVLLFVPSAFGITIVADTVRQNENDVTVFFTLTEDGKSYKWHCDLPKGVNISSALEAKKERYYELILKRLYRGARPQEAGLEAMKTWIENGAKNVTVLEDTEGKPYEVVEQISKGEWKSTHPKSPSLESRIKKLEERLAAFEK